MNIKLMNNRLLQFLQSEGISQSQFADEIGVARGSVSHILSGRNKPSFDMIQSVSQHFPAINLDWLINGEGSMYKDEPADLFAPSQNPENQHSDRKIVKIAVFFSDGTYQEMYPGQ